MRLLLCEMYASRKVSAMKCTKKLPHARPTMHCIPLVIGARCARPTLVDKTKICLYIYIYIYIFIYIYGTCVFRIYIHPAPFVRDAIFPHCMLVHEITVAQEKRLAGQKG